MEESTLNQQTAEILEYNKIKETLKGFAISQMAKEMIENLEPYVDIQVIQRSMMETTEARNIVSISSSAPIHNLKGIQNVKNKLEKGEILSVEELSLLARFMEEGKKLKKFVKDKEYGAPNISSYALSIYELIDVTEEIDKCIVRGRVDDKASSTISKIRKKINIVDGRIKSKLESYLKSSSYKEYLQDSVISQRDGKYVIPIKSEHKRSIEGEVLDTSASGSTVFIEPIEIKKLQRELDALQVEEEKEVYKILCMLTAEVSKYEREISINIETMVYYDFLFAKGKYSKSIDGKSAVFNINNYINIKKGRHPLIGSKAIPLDFEIGTNYKSLVITGPNTGGKTVVLKTVGLLTMMALSGLHVPTEEESEFAIFLDILADIGDGQSIEQNLSTFSSHIKNIIHILACADKNTLVLVDEIGSGTDPGEGMGIGTAVLEELYKKGAVTIATTHYSEIKDFAKNTEGFINGCMGFDIKTLKPLYKLTIGEAGESNAFLIALRLGMQKELIERAHIITYKEQKEYTSYDMEETSILDEGVLKQHYKKIEQKKKIEENKAVQEKRKVKSKFNIGDNVYISTLKRTGIICETENSRGEVGVMVQNKKLKINHKRLSLYIEGQELYPENYDFDIIFESKEDRKAKHLMNRKYVKGIQIERNKE